MSEIVLCCVCLVETDEDVVGLFDKYAKSELFLWNILFDVIGVDAYGIEADMIPSASKICRPCSVRLIESYEFQKLCQKNWDKLISMTNGIGFNSSVDIENLQFSHFTEFMRKGDVEPSDCLKYRCNDCQTAFSESSL